MSTVHTVSSLDRFSDGPREGHLARLLRIACHLKKRPNLELVCDPTETTQTNNGRMAIRKELMVRFPDAVEEIFSGLPLPKYEPLPLSACYDSNLSHHRVMRRSTCGVAGIVGKIEIIHNPKRETSSETPTHDAKLNSGKVSIDCFQDIRYIWRSLGMELSTSTK